MKSKLHTAMLFTLCFFVAGCTKEQKEQKFPDRQMYNLQGEVKSIGVTVNKSGSDKQSYNLEFQNNGACTTHWCDIIFEKEESVAKIERNSSGQITTHTIKKKEDNSPNIEIKYYYNNDGRVESTNSLWYGESVVTENFEYDSEGRLVKSIKNILDYNNPLKETTHYRYTTFDEKNNWTQRMGLSIKERVNNGTVVSDAQYIEKRAIIYY